jgi:hypothetical protein
MPGTRRDEALKGLDGYEQMVDSFAERAKAYWRMWGMMGEHMVRNVDSWAAQQRSYVQWLRQTRGEGIDPNRPPNLD